jgi:hypothetical protein
VSDQQIPREYSYNLWVHEPMPEELADALLDECSGNTEDVEAYTAYFREFADKDEWYSAERIMTAGSNALARPFNSWEEVGDEWLYDHGGTGTVDTLMGVADDEEKTVLHHLVKKVGLQYGPRESEWWYESGLLADGLLYCFNRP